MTEASEETTPRAVHDEPAVGDAQSAAIDADTIRRTCEVVLWAPRLSGEEREAALLLGHVNLLLPEVAGLVRRARGEEQRTGVHVMGCALRALRAAGGVAPADADGLSDMATYCRALLNLYQQLSVEGDQR
ncbi:hypothetical protein [Streptomyces alanosinicus]|uniref:Uncharacterized protein n=1 Tax=Streptomyces alanosinicus TaxID=68171 RepID=A0A918YSQ1_9ACTN|nr:hypothetical protein [Streptomyces alanosinicus]GHE14144.1 hypothetical protein GCM10010339_83710 [Streptomyces alanosinicus]